MILTVLGNQGPFPAPQGACSGYLLESDSQNTRILLDCGAGTLANLRGTLEVNRLTAIIISHLHYDHMSDLLPLRYALQFHPSAAPIPTLTPQTPENICALVGDKYLAQEAIADCRIGEINFRFLRVNHPVESYALCAEGDGRRFCYTGDTNRCEGLTAFCKNADLLLADAGLIAADWGAQAPHLSAALCARLANDAHASRLLLTHLNPCYDPQQLEAEARADFTTAKCCRIGERYVI